MNKNEKILQKKIDYLDGERDFLLEQIVVQDDKFERLVELSEEAIDLLRGWGVSHIPDKQQERINYVLYEIRELVNNE